MFFSIVCIGVNLAFSGTIIGLSSALLYDMRTPSTILVQDEVTLYELNETYNLNAKLPNSYRKDGFIYQSYDETIATIDSEGTITAVSYGSTTIEIFNTSKTANKLVSILVKPPHFKYSLLPPNAYTTKPFELHIQVDDYDKYDNISENTEFYVKDNKGEILDAVYDGANVVVTARMFNLPNVENFYYTLGYRYKGIEVTYSENYRSVVSQEGYCIGVSSIYLPSEYNFSLTVGGSADFVYTWWDSDIIDPGITITILEPTIAEYRDGKIYGISAGQFTVVATSISGVSKTETYIVYA